jgi:sarcosine oxidase
LPRKGTVAVVGGGVLGLSVGHALAADGFRVTVHEQHAVGTPLGSSSGRSRIYRTSYDRPAYVRLARLAIEEWMRLDPALLLPLGLVETGDGAALSADALAACGEPHEWVSAERAAGLLPEAVFTGDVLWTPDAGVVRADVALARLRDGLDVREGSRVADPRELDADIVCVCAGAWLGELFALPVLTQLEQVAYFGGAGGDRPCFIDHGNERDPRVWYGLTTPGVGYKLAQDDGGHGPFPPDRSERPVDGRLLRGLTSYVGQTFHGLDPEPLLAEACIYTMSPDRDFILDTIGDIVVLGGDSGHAFKFGPLLGRLAADLAQGRDLPAECEMFRAGRLAGG